MKSHLVALLAGGAFVAAGSAALAHHSFAMFDAEHPLEIAGTVKEFRFVSPHTILIVTVKGQDGAAKDWILEGDEITVKINPLHSGDPGGSFAPALVKFKDGTSVATPR